MAHQDDPKVTRAFMSVSEFAQRAGVSATTIKRWCDRGELAHLRIPEIGGTRRIPTSELDRLLGQANQARGTR